MRVAVLVVSCNRPDLVRRAADWLARHMTYDHDLFVVEAGTDPDKLTEHTTLRYEDADFRGKCFAHGQALAAAQERARTNGRPYDYYWVLMNDVVFDEGVDAARLLVETMEREPRLAILSPTCRDRAYPGSDRRTGGGWRPVTTCDYLGFMLRAAAVDEVGFLNPDFRYCWGAIHELSYLLYRAGWIVGYSDDVEYEHLGGTTYGAPGTNTISRDEYQREAKRFAYTYLARTYGADWHRRFLAAAEATLGAGALEQDTYAAHRALWATALRPDELLELNSAATTPDPLTPKMQNAPSGPTDLLRLHLGCGKNKRAGWVNVDVNPDVEPDLVADVTDLSMLPDGSCAAIEACHLFEHLTFTQAQRALGEWRRLLAPGGQLFLELPNFARCLELIGEEIDGYDLGLYSIFGYPPDVDTQGAPQLHKWGWTPATLAQAMLDAGFDDARAVPVTQTWRKATAFDRDMRVVGIAAAEAPLPASDEVDGLGVQAVLAWPRYDQPALLDRFMHEFARVLSERDDTLLFLRVDPAVDPPSDAAVASFADSHRRILGEEAPLEVRVLDGPLSDADWRGMGELLACRIHAHDEPGPRAAAEAVPAPTVRDGVALRSLLEQGAAVPAR